MFHWGEPMAGSSPILEASTSLVCRWIEPKALLVHWSAGAITDGIRRSANCPEWRRPFPRLWPRSPRIASRPPTGESNCRGIRVDFDATRDAGTLQFQAQH
jgi:hypothetical protein